MQKFVRGNEIVCSGTFTPVTGSAQPAAAEAVLVYTNTDGDPDSSTISLSADVNHVWSGVWDSNLAQAGCVEWVIRSSGGLQAAAQGTFLLLANAANTGGP